MHIEIIRSRAYKGQSLEIGRVYLVDANFAGWMVSRGFAKVYVEPVRVAPPSEPLPAAEPAPAIEAPAKVKRGRAAR